MVFNLLIIFGLSALAFCLFDLFIKCVRNKKGDNK